MNMKISVVTLILSSLLIACSHSPPVQFYVLETIKPQHSAPQKATSTQTIGVGPIALPALYAQKKLLTRTSDNTVKIAEYQQWAAPLDDSFLQTFSENLALLRPQDIVWTYPWSVHGTVNLQVIVDVSRFDSTPGKSADLEANWIIKNEKNNEILKTGHATYHHPLNDSSYPGTVHALSLLLGEFSQAISSSLSTVSMSN